MTREEAHKLIDTIFDSGDSIPVTASFTPEATETEAPTRVLPEGKRVVRTPSSGDRVYLLDEEKKTRQWVTTEQILLALGFEMADVTEVTDTDLLKYNMASALYRAPDADAQA